jgi:hypothetical protein
MEKKMVFKLSFQKWTFSKAVKKRLLAEFESDKTTQFLGRVWDIYKNTPESPFKDESKLLLN